MSVQSFCGWRISWQKQRILGWIWRIFGEDEGFFYFSLSLPKIVHLCQCLHYILMREGISSTEHVQMLHWACADILMRGNPVTYMTDDTEDTHENWQCLHTWCLRSKCFTWTLSKVVNTGCWASPWLDSLGENNFLPQIEEFQYFYSGTMQFEAHFNLFYQQTRMHSSRMHTACSSSGPWGGLPQCMLGYPPSPQVWAWRPPQVWAWRPLWVWAWRPPWPDLSASPLGVGLETPLDTCKACWDTTCNAC